MGHHCEVNKSCIVSIWVSHSDGYVSTITWDITPSSPLKVNGRFDGKYRVYFRGLRIRRTGNQRESRWQAEPAFTLVSCSVYSSTLKMEAIYSSETSVDFQRTTLRYIREVSILQCPNVFTSFWSVMCLPILLHSYKEHRFHWGLLSFA
jgi:hypothetical protein